MTDVGRRMFIGVSVLALLATAPSMKAATEDHLIANLSSSDEGKVITTTRHLKESYRGSTKTLPAMKKLLTDSRLKVRERAAGTLGLFRAGVNEEDIKASARC
jgi:hypothetical protein